MSQIHRDCLHIIGKILGLLAMLHHTQYIQLVYCFIGLNEISFVFKCRSIYYMFNDYINPYTYILHIVMARIGL